jgi:hypothetical protein
MSKPRNIPAVCLATSLAFLLSGCGMTGLAQKNYTVEECAEVMTAYMEMDAIAMLTCRQYLAEAGQDQFNVEVEQLKSAVAEGRTMTSDLEAGISQFENDLGITR